ncbi:MAG: glycosyltransferase family 2 protein [Actinomycetia bacterium]|nr:glycosyltransferase family 2 protein [Actinomycetes bacterium]
MVPTYNERDNITTLLDRLGQVLIDFDYEIIVVDDDSPDQTWLLAEQRAESDRRIRLLRRVGRRGLSSAVVEGMTAAQGSVLAVIDADLQHDEAILPQLVSAVIDDDVDVSLGSREAPGGDYGEFGPIRRAVSWGGAQLARQLTGITVSDPMSGYFCVSRARFDEVRSTINPLGFKILLELLARGRQPRVAEVGYQFRSRTRGQTKLTSGVALAYLRALVDLSLARTMPGLFIVYAIIAIAGLSIRVSAASILIPGLGLGLVADLLAIEGAIVTEFILHDRYTFAAKTAQGPGPVGRFIRFHLVAWHAILAILGLGSLVETQLRSPLSVTELVMALAVTTLGVMAMVSVSYWLNRSTTWPMTHGRQAAVRTPEC